MTQIRPGVIEASLVVLGQEAATPDEPSVSIEPPSSVEQLTQAAEEPHNEQLSMF